MKKFLNILIGCLVISVGVLILRHSNIATGGTAGLSLSLSYILSMPFALLFFIVNIPFYILSVVQMGWKFTLSTVFAVSMVSLITSIDHWIPDFFISPIVGAIIGGAIIGTGLVILLLNRASLGGSNILALFLQKKFNWNPGTISFIFDSMIVLSGLYFFGLTKAILAILSLAFTASIISYYKNRIAISNNTQHTEKALEAKVMVN